MTRFEPGTVALVTGASRGIGRAIALELAREGAEVVVNYNSSETDAKEVVRQIEDAGGSAWAIGADVSSEPDVRSMFAAIRREAGRLDVLVANAGINVDSLLMRFSAERFEHVLRTNVMGTFLCCREALRMMAARRTGSIVTISSSAGIDGGFAGQTAYAASKGAVIALTKGLAGEAARYGVRANAVAPGFTETDMLRGVPAQARQSYASRIRLRRFAAPDEIARTVTFVASDAASYITGAVLEVDGGGVE